MIGELVEEIARQVPCVRALVAEGDSEVADFSQAISACKGSPIFLAESGDVWQPNKISAVLGAFSLSHSVLVLHDATLVDIQGKPLAPSLLAVQASRPGFSENLLHNNYLGSCMAFHASFVDFILPVPKEASRFDQWVGFVAERFGGVALITKPLEQKSVVAEGGVVLGGTTSKERRGEQRKLLKALKKREKKLRSKLKRLQEGKSSQE
jgi:hypothetical protein